MSTIINESVKFNYNTRVCRVCFIANSENTIEMNLENGLLALFEFCVGISLTSDDQPLLCKTCMDTVKTYVIFKRKCHQSETYWKSVLVTSKLACEDKIKIDDNIKSENEFEANESNVSLTNNDFEIESPSLLGTSDIYEDNVELPETDYQIENVKNETRTDTLVEGFKDNVIKLENENNLTIASNPDVSNKVNVEKQVAKCRYCQKPYRMKRYLIAHLKSCSSRNKKGSVNSIKNSSEKKSLDCEQDKVNNIPEQAIDRNDKQTKDLLFCGLCEFSSTNVIDLTQHLNEHWSSNVLECKLCDFVGLDLAHFTVHRFSHGPEIKRRFQCHICQRRRSTLLSLHYHYRAMHLKKPGGLCWYCMKQYDHFQNWRKHVMNHENLLRPNYICDHCGQKFLWRSMIVEHMECYHLKTRKFICETCGKVFNRNSNLKLHKESVHEKSPPVKCPNCNRMFKSHIVLRQHQRLHRLKTIVCAVCAKTFVTQKNLDRHMIWHSDDRPYKCSTCGVGYKAKGHLKIHMRNHTGDRPYKCQECERSFMAITQLKIHSSVHTGVRAHKCDFCERSFHGKKRLHTHLTKCHKTDLENEKT